MNCDRIAYQIARGETDLPKIADELVEMLEAYKLWARFSRVADGLWLAANVVCGVVNIEMEDHMGLVSGMVDDCAEQLNRMAPQQERNVLTSVINALHLLLKRKEDRVAYVTAFVSLRCLMEGISFEY